MPHSVFPLLCRHELSVGDALPFRRCRGPSGSAVLGRAFARRPDPRVNGALSVSHWRLMIRPKVLPGVGNQLAIEELIGHARPRGSAALPRHCPLLHEELLVKAHDGVAPHQLIIRHILGP